jgi:hypothetical protein
MRLILWLAAVVVLLTAVPSLAGADSHELRGHVIDPSGLPLPGVVVTVVAQSPSGAEDALSITTEQDGFFTFALPPGRYRLQLQLSGFDPVTRDVVVDDDRSEPPSIDVTLPLARVEQNVTVVGTVHESLLGDAQPDAPATIGRDVIDIAMLPNSQFDDVLPLMPNVVRGPDGLISVAGARAPQSAIFVNGINLTDPVSGASETMLPLDGVDAMQVYSGGYPADLGRATGGVTAVRTRSGDDRFHMASDSMLPRLFYTDHGIDGVAYWDPNVGVGGPLKHGRLYFQQSLSYRFDRNRYTTIVGPDQNLFESLMSWSQIDARISATQHLRVSLGFDPQRTDHANITAFTPAGTTPRVEQGGWSASAADEFTIGRTAIELRGSVLQAQTASTPDGVGPSVVAHDVFRGAYFDTNDREGQRIEAGGSVVLPLSRRHAFKIGGSVDRAAMDAAYVSAPVMMLNTGNSVVRIVSFRPGDPVHVATGELAAFAQDTWTPTAWLTIDSGIRYDEVGAVAASTLSPRVSWTVKTRSADTVVSGSAGVFGDKLPLSALAFPDLPTRAVQTFDATGAEAVAPVEYVNRLDGALRLARAARWNVEIDRRFAGAWTLRERYEERRGTRELVVGVVDPATTARADQPDEATGALILSNDGTSLARSLETTIGYRAEQRVEAYVSYVRSTARGNQNSLDTVEGTFRTPFVQPDQIGPLPIDVPNRMLLWGVLHAPSRVTVAPFVDLRDGFPFTAVDDGWVNAGAPNSYRLPWFASLDLSATKIVSLPHHLPDARLGVKLYNIASMHTERDVQRDRDRPDFGTTYDPVPRDFAMVFEFLWGGR